MDCHLGNMMKNLDTIDVTDTSFTTEDGRRLSGIGLVLNGELVKGTFDELMFVCASSFKQLYNIELMTCSCGNAGCAGIFYGTNIKHRRYTVEWRDIDCGFPKRFYNFGAVEYKATVEKARNLILGVVEGYASRQHKEDYYEYGIDSIESVSELSERMDYTKAWLECYNLE